MANKMLIDASHPEETRVVVVRGNRIEEFDFESQDKKQLKGNIYLARVTRVEPSLQAAFVEYGGNRHGFLAFSEIHPDYYQIPMADRQALLRAEAEAAEDEDDDNGDEGQDRGRGRRRRRGGKGRGGDSHGLEAGESGAANGEAEAVDAEDENGAAEEGAVAADADQASEVETPAMSAAVDAHVVSEPVAEASSSEERRGTVEEVPGSRGDGGDESEVESVGAEDALEEVRNRRRPMRRQYKIQEVIKRRQILLVQVVKEERGNKGAALTTYLSLAGRYSVLMPNTARGGGISRKITNVQDRKRLKEIVQELEVPTGMGVILRTAGESRTKAEIKRDYEYLMRLWENVRNLTLSSIAPALVYEEGSLIKRSVRDLYNKDIDEILVSGEDAYREAKDFMRMLMPSHAKVVQPYRDTTPIFARNGIEAQLDKMLQPQVTLKSGGYIIINQTEALVSIDVNSGRSTKEHSIEDTALQTNLEAAEEIARQLRLRDLAGLIVIDFIDMEENRNNRAVEKKLKDCLKNDRARIQVGRISHFGLLEMSRQRIRASVLDSTMKPCPHCGGAGHVRSESSVALLVVRAIEEFLLKDSRNHITVRTPTSTALYVLNHKRPTLVELEERFGLKITVEADESVGAQHYVIARGAVAEKPQTVAEPAPVTALIEPEELESDVIEAEIVEEEEEPQVQAQAPSHHEEGTHRDHKRRRRRRRRGGRDRDREHMPAHEQAAGSEAVGETRAAAEAAEAVSDAEGASTEDQLGATGETVDNGERKKRRRGKRGGKRNRAEQAELGTVDQAIAAEAESEETEEVEPEAAEAQTAEAEPMAAETAGEEVAAVADEAAAAAAEIVAAAEEAPAEKPKVASRRGTRSKKTAAAEAAEGAEVTAAAEAKPKKPRASRKKVVEPEAPAAAGPEEAAAPSEAPAPADAEPATAEAATAEAEPVTAEAEAATTESAPEAAAAESASESVSSTEDSASETAEATTAEDASSEKQEEPAEALVTSSAPAAPDAPKKGGWWQRRGFF